MCIRAVECQRKTHVKLALNHANAECNEHSESAVTDPHRIYTFLL
jgi:hypothetical protein